MSKYIFLAVTLLMLNAPSVFGCECIGKFNVEAAIKSADVIFSGSFVSAEYKEVNYESVKDRFEYADLSRFGEKRRYEILTFRFKVERWWKGNLTDEITLFSETIRVTDDTQTLTIMGNSEKGFEMGKRYLFYVWSEKGLLVIPSCCAAVSTLDNAKEDLEKLGKGNLPRKPAAQSPKRNS